MSQDKINSEENSGLIKRKTKKIGVILLLSGLFIAISYIVLLIPFAIYSAAQVSAMLGKRFGLLIMLLVSILLLLLAFVFESPLLLSSVILLTISIPFIMIGIIIREKMLSKNIALFVLLLPFIFGFCSFTFLPVLNTTQFNSVLAQLEQNITSKKEEVLKQVQTNVLTSSSSQIVAKYDEALSQVNALGNIKELREFFAFNPWQRMVWFVFASGSFVLFFALLISFANLVFLDFAYEQVEKIKAIISYVAKNAASFSNEFVIALSQMPINAKSENSFRIVKHESNSLKQGQEQGIKVIRLSLFKAPKTANRISLKGYSFIFEGKLKSWNLRQFALPLPFALFSIVYMAAVMFWFGGSDGLIFALAKNHYAPLIALGSVFSFAILSVITLQGLFTFYLCVSNFVGFLFLFILFVLGSSFSIGYYAILAIFGSIALLDYVYDWRGKVSR